MNSRWIKQSLIAFIIGISWGLFAHASVAPNEDGSELRIKQELSKRYPGAQIELLGAVAWAGEPVSDIRSSQLLNESQGEARLAFRGPEHQYAEARVKFAARMPAYVAKKRVRPGDRIQDSDFALQDVNVATGQAYEYRGILVSKETSLSGLESRQTILEGQHLISTAVQRVPDVRRGDSVRIHVVAGELNLIATGQAQEPGYLNDTVKVLTTKTKRELSGKLLSNNVVEVTLQ